MLVKWFGVKYLMCICGGCQVWKVFIQFTVEGDTGVLSETPAHALIDSPPRGNCQSYHGLLSMFADVLNPLHAVLLNHSRGNRG